MELLELLELYCELLLARFGLLEQKYVLSFVTVSQARSISKLVPENQIQVRDYFQYTVIFTHRSHVSKGISEGVCSIIHAAPRTELKGETPRVSSAFTPPFHTTLRASRSPRRPYAQIRTRILTWSHGKS